MYLGLWIFILNTACSETNTIHSQFIFKSQQESKLNEGAMQNEMCSQKPTGVLIQQTGKRHISERSADRSELLSTSQTPERLINSLNTSLDTSSPVTRAADLSNLMREYEQKSAWDTSNSLWNRISHVFLVDWMNSHPTRVVWWWNWLPSSGDCYWLKTYKSSEAVCISCKVYIICDKKQ